WQCRGQRTLVFLLVEALGKPFWFLRPAVEQAADFASHQRGDPGFPVDTCSDTRSTRGASHQRRITSPPQAANAVSHGVEVQHSSDSSHDIERTRSAPYSATERGL